MQYVAYADGLTRAYNIHTYAVLYTLQRKMGTTLNAFIPMCMRYPLVCWMCPFIVVESTFKLIGAGAFAFHPTLEWVFVGDRRGTLLAWDVSTDRPSMIGM